MQDQGTSYVPTSQEWLLLRNAEIINNGFEVISKVLGLVGGVAERLAANSLTTNIIPNLLKV
jgi:hypothetical protein